jgi:hypothetical protein
MATQQHGLNFKDIVTSFGINQKDFAVSPQGVYAGFDEIREAPSTVQQPQFNQLIILFAHTQTAAQYTEQDGTVRRVSCVKGPHGDVVTERESVPLPVTLNPLLNRIDAVVLRHTHATVQGGAVAEYEIVEGIEGDTEPPTIPLSNERTVIGYLLVKPLALDTTGMEWLRAEMPKFGGFDFRDNGLAMRSMLSLREHLTVLEFNNHRLDLPFDGNIYTVKARATEDQNTIHSLPTRIGNVFHGKETGAVIWLNVVSDNLADRLTIYDVANMNELGATLPPNGYKFIKTGIGNDIMVSRGGVVQLIERADFWEVVAFQDFSTHTYALAQKLQNKGIWWLEKGFVSAVSAAIGQTVIAHSRQSATVTNGLIDIGSVTQQRADHRNIVELDVPTGVEEIFGVAVPFMFTETVIADGAEIIFKFGTIADGKAVLRLGTGANRFKSADGFDFVVKGGSIVKCLQTTEGLVITEGSRFIKWITPPNVNGEFEYLGNGFEYAVFPDGFIRFRGSLSIKAATMRKVFTLPDVFKEIDFLITRAFVVPRFDGTGLHQLRYGKLGTEGWGVYSDNGTEAVSVCMEGVQISY